MLEGGNQTRTPYRAAAQRSQAGAPGQLAAYIATIEPWHGYQVVVYTPPDGAASEVRIRRRTDSGNAGCSTSQLKWGHAVWCADLDGDGDEELVIGVRDEFSRNARCGVRIYSKPARSRRRAMAA